MLGDILKYLESYIDNLLFKTSLGRDYKPEEIEATIKYNDSSNKAIFLFLK